MPVPSSLCPGCFLTDSRSAPCPTCGFNATEVESPLRLPLNHLLNEQYLLGKILGKPGGFGITYLAWDSLLQTRLAIKEFFPAHLVVRDPKTLDVTPDTPGHSEVFFEGLTGFLLETRTLARFDHPNIVRVRQYFEAHNTAYLVMDYYEGETSDAVVRRSGPLSERRAAEIMLPILEGLEQIHSQDVLHRDIKPDNVYITRNNRAILLDFGAARAAVGKSGHNMSVVLTPGFAPAEQYSSAGNQGPWTDVYACGATLYYLVTKSLPQDAMDRTQTDELFASLDGRFSPDFTDVLRSSLALEHQSRFQTAGAMANALRSTTRIDQKPALSRSISCPTCAATNRVAAGADIAGSRCGNCNEVLLPAVQHLFLCPNCRTKNRLPEVVQDIVYRCAVCRRRLPLPRK